MKKKSFSIYSDLEGVWDNMDWALFLMLMAGRKFGFDGETAFKRIGAWVIGQCKRDDFVSPGDTLFYILPCLNVANLLSNDMADIVLANMRLVPNAKEVISRLCKLSNFHIISTAYNHCIVPKTLGVNKKRIICTEVQGINTGSISHSETLEIVSFIKEIAESTSVVDCRIEEIMNAIFNDTRIGRAYKSISIVNQYQKYRRVMALVSEENDSEGKRLGIGDSITDNEFLNFIGNESNGISLSINGSGLAENNIVQLAYIGGNPAAAIEEVVSLYRRYNRASVIGACSPRRLAFGGGLLMTVTESNATKIEFSSKLMRKKIRGEAGKLP
jgi:predicted HAD superfamily phosphohydrolase